MTISGAQHRFFVVATSEAGASMSPCCSHYGVTGSMRWSRVRLRLFEEPWSEPQGEGTSQEREDTILGLDVHAETIAVAVAEPDGAD